MLIADTWALISVGIDNSNCSALPYDVRCIQLCDMIISSSTTSIVDNTDKENAVLRSEAEKQTAILAAEGDRQASILRAEGEAEAIEKVSKASDQFFVGNAQVLKQLEVTQASLANNTKIVVSDQSKLINVLWLEEAAGGK